MRLKPGVTIAGLKFVMRPVMIEANEIWLIYQQELVVTSGLEGEHWAGSLHPFGYALDLRINYWGGDWDRAREFGKGVAADLKEALGVAYRVILESTHIHVEYNIDRK